MRCANAEMDIAETVSIHYRSVALQTRYILLRNSLHKSPSAPENAGTKTALKALLEEEIVLARRLHAIQSRNSLIGFEASNHYFYVPVDLAEKIVQCEYLSERIDV